jgi:phosphatidylglycerophosphate synthase
MFDTRLRPIKDMLITPLADAVGRILSPNGVSLLAFAAGMACAASLLLGHGMAAFPLWALNRVLDGLDGLIARRSRRTSDAGGYLDIMLDFLVYASIPLAMAWADPGLAYACALLLAAFYVNSASWMYLSALLEKHGRGASERGEATSIPMPAGVIEGGETILFTSLMILLPAWRMTLFLLFAGLTIASAAIRFRHGFRLLRKMGGGESGSHRPPEQS